MSPTSEQQEREALPPLPEPLGEFFVLGRDQAWNERTGQYTADQMHAYARAALAATPAPAPEATPAQAQQADEGVPVGSGIMCEHCGVLQSFEGAGGGRCAAGGHDDGSTGKRSPSDEAGTAAFPVGSLVTSAAPSTKKAKRLVGCKSEYDEGWYEGRDALRLELALRAKAEADGDDDQAWDRNAERLTREAFGLGGGINPNATSIDDIFLDDEPAQAQQAALLRLFTSYGNAMYRNDPGAAEQIAQRFSAALAATPAPAEPFDSDVELRTIGDALLAAHDHLEMHKLELSHCNSAATIRNGLATYSAWKKRGDMAATPAPAEADALHAFKNFHRNLCNRFGYFHDDENWQRDLCSLEEHIAGYFKLALAATPAQAQQAEAKPLTLDAFDEHDLCNAWAGLPIEFFNPGPSFGASTGGKP